MSKANDSEETH